MVVGWATPPVSGAGSGARTDRLWARASAASLQPPTAPPANRQPQVGFYRDPGTFFTFYLVITGCSLSVSSLFRLIACVCPNMVVANAAGGLLLVMLIVTSGGWLKWLVGWQLHGAWPGRIGR